MLESNFIENDKSVQVRKYQAITNKIKDALVILDRHFDDDVEFNLVFKEMMDDVNFKRDRKFIVTIKPIGKME